MATALANLQSAYLSVAAKIADVLANPLPSYTLPSGASVNRDQYYAQLLESEKALRAIPGVAPDTVPVFEVISVAR